MIRLEQYLWSEHLPLITKLLEVRGLPSSLSENLPAIGFLAFKEDVLIGAGFLRQCEGNVGLMDSFITDPAQPGDDRNTALDMLTFELIEIAKQNKFTSLLAYSTHKKTLMRSTRHGFEETPYTVMSLNLTSGQEV